MTRPAAPVGWTPSLPRCCPQEEFWSFSYSHCNICAEFFLTYSQGNISISWRISCTGKMQPKNWQIKIVLLVLTDRHVRGKVGRYLPWLGLLLPLIGGRLIKSSCISICILFLCICICICLSNPLPSIDRNGGWSVSTQEPHQYQKPFLFWIDLILSRLCLPLPATFRRYPLPPPPRGPKSAT